MVQNILWIPNKLKQFPLHLVIMKRHSIISEIIQLIIKQSLQQPCNGHDSSLLVLQEDAYKCTPFHYLWATRVNKQYQCEKEVNFDEFDSLYQKSLEKIKDAKGQENFLADMLFGSSYIEILKWLLSYSHPQIPYLHAVCKIPSSPANVVALLVLLYPRQLLKQDKYGKNPLHYASSSSFEKMEVLLRDKKALFSIRMKDNERKLPLHYLIKAKFPNKLKLVQTLLKHYPESVESFESRCKLYPFMMAAAAETRMKKRNDDLDVIYHLLRMSPSLIR